ncbi:MFS transporter [Jatrophihabitans telluris]|uniref:MFS transporter n=1 Tax=Jatrophihabitans telluris TaxID=2038343 RepID=A0ABY4QVA9_9ACTN|nr:MFS transporter [Jatrophihabitans telluris]UQX86806.1 MFS transporter [Jatrophihabitans telluris]
MTETDEAPFSLRSIALPAFGPAIMFGAAEGAVLPVVALTALHLGASVAAASVVYALIGIGSLVSNIPSAMITQRLGERFAIVLASGVSASAMLVAMLAPDVAVLAVAMLLIGFANAVFSLARQSFLTENVPVRWRARALSSLGGSARVGVFIGPFLAAAAIHQWGIRAAYAVGLVAALTAGGIGLFSADLVSTVRSTEVEPETTTIRAVLRSHRRLFLTIGIGVILISAVRASRQVVLPLWAEHIGLSPTANSLIYGVAGAVDMAVFYPAGKVMDRKGRLWVVLPSMLLLGASLMLVPLCHHVGWLLVLALLLGFGNGIGSGMVMTLGADYAPAHARPAFLGIWRFLSDLGSCGGPLLLSVITGAATLAAGVVSNGGIGFVAATLLAYFVPRTPIVTGRAAADPSSGSGVGLPARASAGRDGPAGVSDDPAEAVPR